MKRLLHIDDNTENRISYYLLLCFLITLPFDRFYSTLVLIGFLLHSIIFLRKEKLRLINRETFILQSVIIVSILAAGYAVSFQAAMNSVTKQLAILLFPLLFAISSFDINKYRNKLLEVFAVGCMLTIIYLFTDAFRVILFNNLPLKALFSQAFVNHNFSLPIDLHATYFSMFLLISLVYMLEQLSRKNTGGRNIFLIACSVILLAGIIQLSSKAVLISLLLILNIAVPWYLLKGKRRILFMFASLAISTLMIVTVLSVNVFRERLMVDFKNDLFKGPESERVTWRISRWDVAVDLIRRAPVIGNGSGSEIPLLKELYFERKMYAAYLGSLNVHNQYLSFLINSGIIGLLIYMATLCWGFWQAIRLKDILLLSFMIVITVVSFSEDILDVNKGIFFYAFFFSFFIMSASKKAGVQQATMKEE